MTSGPEVGAGETPGAPEELATSLGPTGDGSFGIVVGGASPPPLPHAAPSRSERAPTLGGAKQMRRIRFKPLLDIRPLEQDGGAGLSGEASSPLRTTGPLPPELFGERSARRAKLLTLRVRATGLTTVVEAPATLRPILRSTARLRARLA